jgi:flagellar L-ring protein precursor FlgH
MAPRATTLRAAAGMAILLAAGWAIDAAGADLYRADHYSPLIADRRAEHVGDSLTVIINESSTATNATSNQAAKNTSIGGQITANSRNQALQLGLNNSFDGSGQTGRSGKMVAQLSVIVVEVLANGDLRVAGDQSLNINGDRTKIKLSGRVRSADISSTNSILSTSLADAVIDYDGKGFTASSAKPGIIAKVFGWLGLT